MGQYYKTFNLDQKCYMQRIKGKPIGGGIKLMEISYYRNNLPLILMLALADKQVRKEVSASSIIGDLDWCGGRIVHCGDYADPREFLSDDDVLALDEKNRSDSSADWYGKYGRDEAGLPNVNLYNAATIWPDALEGLAPLESKVVNAGTWDCDLDSKTHEFLTTLKNDLVAINEADKTFFRYKTFFDWHRSEKPTDDWVLDPLLLLLAYGNGRGGGDYRSINQHEVGSWAGKPIRTSFQVPDGFVEIFPRFRE